MFQVAVVSLCSSCCWCFSLNAFGVSSSSCFFGAGDLNEFLAMVACVSPSHPPSSFLSLIHSVLTGAWNGGSWLGCKGLPAMGAVFYLEAGWPPWKPLDIPGTHFPLKRGSGLIKNSLSISETGSYQKCLITW